MSIVNTAKPSTSLTNASKVSFAVTWDTWDTTWQDETRTWDELLSTMDNVGRPVTPTATAYETPYSSPGTMADVDTVGAVEWATPDNAKLSDNVYAGTFDAVDASIVDSEVKIVKSDGTIGTTNKADTSTVWPNAGADAYASYGDSTDLWGETWTVADINDADFGVVISAGDASFTHYLKATNFGFSVPTGATINGIKVEIEKSKDGFGGGRVDHIRIKIYYTLTTSGTGMTMTNVSKP